MTTHMTTHTLHIPGTTLTYDVRCNEASNEPPQHLIGSAMAAAGLAMLSSHFGDRTVITDDPRGCEWSVLTNPDRPITPDLQTRGRGQPRKPNAA